MNDNSIRIYVQSDRVPGAIAVVDLAQELEEGWQTFSMAVRAEMLRTLQRLPGEREVLAYLCRVIAERIKWTAPTVLTADPAAQTLNDVIAGAGDRARADVVKDLVKVRELIERAPRSGDAVMIARELGELIDRHSATAQATR